MSVATPGTTIKELQATLMQFEPPYLLRKYEAVPEDFEVLADENLKCEYLNGVLIVHSPATLDHEDLVSFLIRLIGDYATPRGLGTVYGSNAVMQLGRPRFCPDVSFLKTGSRTRIAGGRVKGPMDLAIEVLSKSTRDYDLGDKRMAYRDGRVPEIWLIDPESSQVHLDFLEGGEYRSQTLKTGKFSSRVVADLPVEVAWFWATPLPDPLACLGIPA
jgi:Uma2 family endonuclease